MATDTTTPATIAALPPTQAPVATSIEETTTRRLRWGYRADSKRDLRIDLLRGYAVFAMVVDHVGGKSWLHAITGGNQFFVSAAEVFVFISGLTVGLVYGARMWRDGLWPTVQKLLLRSWTLYTLAVWLALATAFAAALFDLPRGVILSTDPARFIIDVLTLQRTFYLVDVMLFYAFAMLCAPLALIFLRKGLWWLLALLSIGLWAAYQFWPTQLQLPWLIADNPVFNFAAWQILFFLPMILGYERQRISQWFAQFVIPRFMPAALFLFLAGTFAALVYVHVTNGVIFARYVPGGDTAAWLDRWFDKSALPLPRLIAFGLVFGFLWLLVSHCWVPLSRALSWFLLPLGQGALYAYSAHLFVLVGLQLFVLHTWGRGRETGYAAPHAAWNAVLQLAGVGTVWGLTKLRFLWSVVSPLGGSPVMTFRLPKSSRIWPRPGDSLAVLLMLFLLTAPFVWSLGIGGGIVLRSNSSTGAAAVASPGSSTNNRASAPPASTVTTPRSVSGSARGSSGLTGRNDQSPGPSPTAVVRSGGVASTAPQPQPSSASNPAITASGGYLKDSAFYSEALEQSMPYGIYLPPTYDSSPDRHYPVVYMLHGAGGHYSEWVAYGLPEAAEDLTWDGQIQPLIIVMPQGDQSYFVNHNGGDERRWGDYIAFDLVAHIDATYRTIPQPSSRAIGGLSMGGFGALQLALLYPDIFGAVGAHSPALRNLDEIGDIIGTDESPEDVDPLEMVRVLDATHMPAIWMDAGSEDTFAERVALFGQILDERGIQHQVRLTPGDHDEKYWTAQTGDYMRFYAWSVVGSPPGLANTP